MLIKGQDTSPTPVVVAGAENVDLLGSLLYTRFLSESFAVTLGVDALPGSGGAGVGPDGVFSGGYSVVVLPLGIRPLSGDHATQAVKPALIASVDP
jgi:hypothetical protein